MAVPLFDTATPLAPLRARARRARSRACSTAALHPRPRGRGVRARVRRRTSACAHVDRRRQRHRRAHARAAGARRRPGRRGRRARRSPSTRAPRRSRRPARRPVFCDVDPDTMCVTAETVRAALTPRTRAVIAVDLFGNVAPIAEIARARRAGASRTPRRRPARGSTAARAGALGDVATFSLLPVQEPRLLRRRRRDRDRRRRARRARARCCASTARATRSTLRADRLQLAPRRAAGGDPARAAAAPRRWCDGRRAAAAHYADAGLGELRRAAASRPTAPSPPGTCTWSATRARTSSARRCSAAGDRRARLLPHAAAPPAGDARRGRRGVALPGTDELGAHAPRDPDEPGARPREQADEVVAARASRRHARLDRPHQLARTCSSCGR